MSSPEFGGSPRSRPFLTSEQREALDAALAQKQGGDQQGIRRGFLGEESCLLTVIYIYTHMQEEFYGLIWAWESMLVKEVKG